MQRAAAQAVATFAQPPVRVLHPPRVPLPIVECIMKLYRRSSSPKPRPQGQGGRSRRPGESEGSNATQPRPDPQAEPIPDGEHKYVPRSPYRTGNY